MSSLEWGMFRPACGAPCVWAPQGLVAQGTVPAQRHGQSRFSQQLLLPNSTGGKEPRNPRISFCTLALFFIFFENLETPTKTASFFSQRAFLYIIQ